MTNREIKISIDQNTGLVRALFDARGATKTEEGRAETARLVALFRARGWRAFPATMIAQRRVTSAAELREIVQIDGETVSISDEIKTAI